jgi:hypothetical protein
MEKAETPSAGHWGRSGARMELDERSVVLLCA